MYIQYNLTVQLQKSFRSCDAQCTSQPFLEVDFIAKVYRHAFPRGELCTINLMLRHN
jgi:hypothetical protein